MKIFSNFDTQFQERVLSHKRKSFSEDQIVIIHRSNYYFIFKVIGHLIGYLFILGFLIAILQYVQAFGIVYVALISVWGLVVWFRIFHKLLKYLYDFTIVTPKGVTTYKQKGILNSTIKEIPSKRIKVIEVCRQGILGNVFGYGYVDIIADLTDNAHMGKDNESPWVVGLTYVDDPYSVKESITNKCFN